MKDSVIVYRSQTEANLDQMINEHPEVIGIIVIVVAVIIISHWLINKFVKWRKLN